MRIKLPTLLSCGMVVTMIVFVTEVDAQRPGSRKQVAASNQMVDRPLEIGEAGVAWYTTWETALKEAERSNRPILFTSAATTCSNVSGVF